MFSWICPKCGSEVPPHENDCPRCSGAFASPPSQTPAAAAPQPKPAAPPPPPPQYAPPPPPPVQYAPPPPPPPQPVQYAPAQPPPQYTPPPPQYSAPAEPTPSYMLPPPKSGMPAWLLVMLVAGGLIGLGYGLLAYKDSPSDPAKAVATGEAAKSAAKDSADHPYSKVIEVAGLRVAESADKKLDIRMVVINHAAGELQEFKLQVDLAIANAKAGTPPIATFTVRVPPIPALGMRDVRTTASTQLRAYEFPDWQFLRADFTILAR